MGGLFTGPRAVEMRVKLQFAAQSGDFVEVRRLIDAGADKDCTDKNVISSTQLEIALTYRL